MLIRFIAMFLVVAAAITSGNEAVAMPYYHNPVVGYAPGAFGVMRPAYYGPYGRYPKLGFHTPLRPWGGITPVRQFLFGRGHFRRVARRQAIFGRRCFRC